MDLLIAAAAAATIVAACGTNSTPTQPTNSGGGSGTCTPPANTPPVIASITAQGTRANEPADFADVGESIPITTVVQDAETPVDQLQLTWTATAGTFSGSGTSVTWQAPASGAVSTPMDVAITLTVVENYGCAGQAPTFKNTVSATHTISLHDSVAEVGGMARQFLLDFSDSTITDVSYIMRNFDLTCSQAQDEASQVALNRQHFHIDSWNIGAATVTVPFGDSLCLIPGRTQRGDACSSTPSHWQSTIIVGPERGDVQVADGVDWVSAYYRSPLDAWKLCDSQFPGTCSDVTAGTPCPSDMFPSMVPGRIK
ncbi:MAG: hypothetical protein ACRD1V_19405 [Vicinamibacterales bacterium]